MPEYCTKNDSEELAANLAQMIHEKHGEEILILDVSGPLVIADFFVIATAQSHRQAQAMASELDLTMKHQGLLRRNMAGLEGESGWVLLDFDTVVVHVFSVTAREFYGLENLWADAPRLPFTAVEKSPPQESGWMTSSDDSFRDSIGKH